VVLLQVRVIDRARSFYDGGGMWSCKGWRLFLLFFLFQVEIVNGGGAEMAVKLLFFLFLDPALLLLWGCGGGGEAKREFWGRLSKEANFRQFI
jgi:hypothetical protein